MTDFTSDFTGKTALITGASRGIGEAVARLLAAQGANVVLFARSGDDIKRIAREISSAGGSASFVIGDVSQFAQLSEAVDHCLTTHGSLDILVNNAGLIDPIARLTDSDPDEWSNVVDVNFKGVYFGLRAALPIMEKQGFGVVVNISSGAATGALEGWSHYCSTKAAVLSLTKCADKEMYDKGIRIVGLSPGTVATDMQVSIKSSGINPISQLDSSVHISAQTAAKAVAYLCTSEADDLHGVDFSIKTEEGRARLGL
ncbi:MAG: short-chain dehydrogenase [Hyphomicrobiales bacterium]|nr:MAG: short-chain dehydrogenase [Hyphomicrobiales bacterium]